MKKVILVIVAMLFAVSCCNTNESAELVITTKDGSTATMIVPLKAVGGLIGIVQHLGSYLQLQAALAEKATHSLERHNHGCG